MASGKKPFTSFIPEGKIIIGDDNYQQFAKPSKTFGGLVMSQTGFVPRDYSIQGYCAGGGKPVPAELLMDEKQIREEIERQERTKSSIFHMLAMAPKLWLRQPPTNYCWCYAVVHAVMIQRYLANLPFERLSPYSVAAMIKKGGNYGGWGTQALDYMVANGVSSTKFWPCETPEMSLNQAESANMAAIRNWRQYADASRADAATRKIIDWYDVRPRNWLEKLSLILHRFAVPSGYNWMGHEMCSYRALILPNGDLGCEDMDHYGSGGMYNTRIMTRSRGTPDDACCVVVA